MNLFVDLAEKSISAHALLLRESGYRLSSIDKKLYNFEFGVLSNEASLKVQTYFGKKGVKTILQGNRDSKLFKEISDILFGKNLFEPDASEFIEPQHYIGTDESGKGDYFGPLVIAGVLVNPESKKRLLNLGVRDSKTIPDNRIKILASEIKNLVDGEYNIVVINPEKYNSLYSEIKNVNKLLAWGHARVIENILSKSSADEAISDKFGDESLIKNVLQEKGKQLILHQFPKAEKYTAVAAASILARDRFNKWFDDQNLKSNINLPKGASEKVEETARKIKNSYGSVALNNLVKLHFKTTKKIL